MWWQDLIVALLCIGCIITVSSVNPYSGVDVSDHVYIDGFQCLKNLGYEFAIVRVSISYGLHGKFVDYISSVIIVMVLLIQRHHVNILFVFKFFFVILILYVKIQLLMLMLLISLVLMCIWYVYSI